MINAEMRLYNYFTYGTNDEYGQPALAFDAQGTIKMSIALTSQSIQDNINYQDAQYIGLTHDANITDKYVIEYGSEKLKVLYINTAGRYKQVFMAVM